MTTKKADVLILFVTFCWGSSYLFMKEGLGSLGPYNLIALRFGLAFLAAALFLGRRLHITRAALQGGFVLGLLIFLGFAALTTGLQSTTTSNAGFLVSLMVVFIPLIEAVCFGKRLSLPVLSGISLAVLGIAFLTLQGGLALNPGDVLCLLSAFFNAVQVLYVTRTLQKADALTLSVLQLGFAGLLAGGASLLLETPQLPASAMGWVSILYLGLICSAFGFMAQIIAQKYTSPERVGILFCLEPVFAAALGVLCLGEHFGLGSLIGASLVLAGVIISSRASDEPEPAHIE